MKKPYLEAGQIVSTHGVQGQVKIQPWADEPAFLTRFSRFYIDGAAVAVRSCRVQKTMCIAALEGYEDVNAAMTLKGKTIFIDRAEARLPEGAVFIQDILGAQVTDEAGNALGILEDVLSEPAASVLVVRGQREILIPDVPAFVLKKDPDAGVVTVRLIEGM
ncbi:MAG: ribosome maturation factor RimM [Oscillospiraceae bacterium]|nr:ribosome maturation factor RimM [Oscillospiraceae bacterium]